MSMNLTLTVILFLATVPRILQSSSVSTVSTLYHHLTSAFESIGSSIPITHSVCKTLNLLFESNSIQSPDPNWTDEASRLLAASESSSVKLLIDLGLTANSGDKPKKLYSENNYHYKHHQPCTFVIFEMSASLLAQTHRLNNATIGQKWPERLLPLLPNDVFSTFFVFFIRRLDRDSSVQSEVNDFTHETGMIIHSIFLIPRSVSAINVFSGLPKSSQPLQLVATITQEGQQIGSNPQVFYPNEFDFKGESFLSAFWPNSEPTEEMITLKGFIYGLQHAWILTLKKLNASPETDIAYGETMSGVDNDDELLDFLLALVEGTTAFMSLVVNHVQTQNLVYTTRCFHYDHVHFFTAPPKELKRGGIYMIEEPLDWPVWIAVIVASLGVLACLEAIQYFESGHHGDMRLHTWLLELVYKPVLDQSLYEANVFRHRVRHYLLHFMLGVWLLSLIVLQCAYESSLLGVIGFPRLILPPRTLRSLAESDYEIGAIMAGPIIHDLKASYLVSNLKIAQRMYEYEFIEPTCYAGIFERKMACVGSHAMISHFGLEFMVDIYGRMIAVESTDSHFLKFGGSAISKFYPMILGPMDWYLGLMDSNGITDYTVKLLEAKTRKKGIAYAKENAVKKKLYRGKDNREKEAEDDHKLINIGVEIILIGLGVSCTTLVVEFLIHFTHRRTMKAQVVPQRYKPQIYACDFRRTAVAAEAVMRLDPSFKSFTVDFHRRPSEPYRVVQSRLMESNS